MYNKKNDPVPAWDKKAKEITGGVQDNHFPDSPVPQKQENPKPPTPDAQLKSGAPISVQVKEEQKVVPTIPKIEQVASKETSTQTASTEDTSNEFITVMHEETQRIELIPLGHSIRDVIMASLAAFEMKGANPDHYILMDWNKKQQKNQFSDIDKKERFTGIVLMKSPSKVESLTISSPEVWRLSITVVSKENSRVFRVPIAPSRTVAEVIEGLIKTLKENNIPIVNSNLSLMIMPGEIVLPLKERIDSAIGPNELDKLLVKI